MLDFHTRNYMNYSTIAGILKISPAAVSHELYEARKFLFDTLAHTIDSDPSYN